VDFQRSKRTFDLAVTLAGMPVWLVVVACCSAALGLTEGRPIFYRSMRRVHEDRSCRLLKFRTMIRDAERIANRDTVPIDDTCFLNIPPESELYTPIGRLYERFALTELPQLFHVLSGKMSLVGNRPLPENVMSALQERYPYAEDRFSLRAGLTGPVQLVGRDNLSDRDRLALEIAYSIIARSAYSMRLDFLMLLHTVLIALKLKDVMDVAQVRQLMIDSARRPRWACRVFGREQRIFRRYPSDLLVELSQPGKSRPAVFPSVDIGYGGLSVEGILPQGSLVGLQLADDAGEPPFTGRVVWVNQSSGRPRTGVEFTEPPSLGRTLATLLGLPEAGGAPQEHAVPDASAS
jgi:lipopolysaccharide/colanic/teichoic acid biosynthesis glycosyltransferase